ncbi:hypothetical protein DFH11DRAFT_1585969 [Phellopilus nigrolimitatus]|nr:hypothetical protein DFH11DRAFT_1585969 [Phellopilus nigrolimitatus]
MLGLPRLTIGDIPGGKLCWFWAGCWCCCCCPRNSAHGRRFTRDAPPTSVLHRQTLFTLLSENHKIRMQLSQHRVAACKSCQRRTRAIHDGATLCDSQTPLCAWERGELWGIKSWESAHFVPQLPFSPPILTQRARGDFCASLGRPFDCRKHKTIVFSNAR